MHREDDRILVSGLHFRVPDHVSISLFQRDLVHGGCVLCVQKPAKAVFNIKLTSLEQAA